MNSPNYTQIPLPESDTYCDRIPTAIINNGFPLDIVVYCKLVSLAKASSREEFTMPPMRELAKTLNVSYHTLDDSLERLESTGWITRTNKDMKKSVRYRTIVKYVPLELEVKLSDKINASELLSKDEWKSIMKDALNETLLNSNKSITSIGDCPIIIDQTSVLPPGGFPPHLKNLHATCIKQDLQKRSLASYSEQLLFEESFGASFYDIERAMLEIEGNGKTAEEPQSKPRDILAIFSSRFIKDRTGKGVLNPNRNSKSKKRVSIQSPETYTPIEPPKELFHFRPDQQFSPADIDTLCERLNYCEWVERINIPDYFFPIKAEWLIPHSDEPTKLFRLNPTMELIKIISGFWRIEYIQKKLPTVQELAEVEG